MKKLWMFLVALSFSLTSQAETVQDLLNVNVTLKPAALSLTDPSAFEAEGVSGYEGRNKNRREENLTSQVKSGSTLSRTVQSKNSSRDAQLENLESTAGELIQKVEDDRIKRTRKHKDSFDSTKNILKKAYTELESVDMSKLGSEQDPEIQNAFKCHDLKACNENPKNATNGTDKHDIKKDGCAKSERLHWNGSSWSCEGIFAVIKKSNCSSDQYSKEVNGGTACIDYLYSWGPGAYEACDTTIMKQKSEPVCYRKKTSSDTNPVKVADSKCISKKPGPYYKSCSYVYANKVSTEVHNNFNPSLPRGWVINCSNGNLRLKTYRYSSLTHNKTHNNWRGGWLNIYDARLFYGHSWADYHCSKSYAWYCRGNGNKDTIYIASCYKAGPKVCPSGYSEYGSATKCRKIQY
jgi:hypothetical protein